SWVSSFCFSNTTPSSVCSLSLHDALPISLVLDRREPRSRLLRVAVPAPERRPVGGGHGARRPQPGHRLAALGTPDPRVPADAARSEEHTSELQSRENLVCRLLLEKKNRYR